MIPGEAKSAWMQALIIGTKSEADVVGSAEAVLSTVALVLRRTFWKVVHWRRVISHHGSNGWPVIGKEWYVYRRFVYSLPLG